MVKKYFLILILAVCLTGVQAQTNIPSIISSDQSWTAANSPYYLVSTTLIQPGAVVTVEPGVRVISTGNFNITVNGCLRALGKEDSMVSFESLTIDFNASALEYNSSTGLGSKFEYTRFTSYAQTGNIVTTYAIDLYFNKCSFDFGLYCIYNKATTGTFQLWVSNSNFNFRSGGYPVYGAYQNSNLTFTGNYFDKSSYLYLGEKNYIYNNYFNGGTYGMYWQYYTKVVDAQCNNFKNLNIAAYIASFNSTGITKMNIRNNIFDSCNTAVYFVCSNNMLDSFHVSENNFINIRIAYVNFASCTNSGLIKSIDFTGNFWGTKDSTKIFPKIMDYRKNTQVPYIIDITNFKSEKTGVCWPLNREETTGVMQNASTPGYIFYPNPAQNELHIQCIENDYYEVKILDVNGKKLGENAFTGNSFRWNIIDVPGGVYMLVLESKSIRSSNKILIQK
ncbi:MAG: T9SS type A sorting domain-containing protein [Bacteroidetes bacterium]|nr:T9SS type A sorting domain-containing protein [Bacteroidota bacterium]